MNKKHNEWLRDFEQFLDSENVSVPIDTADSVLNRIRKLLNPNPFIVFGKLFGIHLIFGFLSLSICHQFGLNPFNTDRSLDEWFMKFGGHNTCMVLCGVLFVSLSYLAAGYFLTLEEVKVLRKNEFLQVSVLGTMSLGLLVLLGAEVVLTLGLLWLLGGILGGLLATELIWKLKIVRI